jgi:hypothetical protein
VSGLAEADLDAALSSTDFCVTVIDGKAETSAHAKVRSFFN